MDYEKIFERIQSGEKVKDIAKDLGCSDSKISRGLKKSGFEWVSNKWIRGEEQPLDNQTTTIKQVNDDKATSKKRVNNNLTTSNQFSNEEVAILKKMIAEFEKVGLQVDGDLYDRIRERETGKERNNIFLNTDIQIKLDSFLKDKKLERNKSLITELALEDFMKKYSK
ncbi:TPA: hypothetical protein ACQ75Q_005598 [Bacillus thuringiensis]|nr:hypothetical protein [Bacillus cereus]HDR4799612.1 hypothetical protein [Bacillus cereus]HDR4805703.1 hypothetical protein [Bacillus cereus]HDR4811674.1 hypothetical protein [Bacillus cereus]HDR4834125.1 hypothetical protein [Bacillus cereus]